MTIQRVLAMLVAAAAAVFCVYARAADPARPNVVVILADDKNNISSAAAEKRLENARFLASFRLSQSTGNRVEFRGIRGN